MIFETSNLDANEIYRLLVGGITPRPIAWISTLSVDGVANIAPYSFFNVASCNPPILWYSQVNPKHGQDKDTLRNLIETKQCAVHIVNSQLLEKMNLSCALLAAEQSEFEFAQIESESSHTVAALAVKHAPIRYECHLREVIQLSSLPSGGTVVLLDVKSIYVDDHLWDGQMIDQQRLDSVGKMGGDFYSLSTDLHKLSRP
ncbi:flavin reductase family protein [Acinetobacter sp. ANC 4805]|jgi:flavin reductase (DIM6/NTAB) family NADH-FMN oxidoreductase RutF|uniref:flavin reductase family protein n=1 Tax=Acinetobacter sp. ANC 4805 TaxID=2923425 RepID=UPI001A259187|nr:flavin reductase family protein [Acinetobacter sp. ANC 4805]MBH2000825.1 flavin reductase family protein [Moraxellaceae bacterium]MBH2030591.1 flavin reductase family protein [Moraxellaceae bacterium]MCH7310088.1 flavin reductase family protein [Acinetobacter sp. ANC 4805]